LEQSKTNEDSIRNLVAECLGVLTAMHSEHIVPILKDLSVDLANKSTRCMIAIALKFCLSRNLSQTSVATLSNSMQYFLPLLDDKDLEVKRSALLMINTAAHHNIAVISFSSLETFIIPALIATLRIKLERTVDLGPFKHKVFSFNFVIFINNVYFCTKMTRLMITYH
jgi:cullin-associated NEDD8-dissociated protein 1